MPQRNKDNKATIIGLVLAAIVGGALIGFQIYNPFPPPPPGPPKVDPNMTYDDTWGKQPTVDSMGTVTHILVSWTGSSPKAKPKEARTEEEARKLIDNIWAQYKNNPTNENWKALQKQYNEDDQVDVHNMYTCKSSGDGWDPKFSECGRATLKNHARIVKGIHGFHLIRREG